MNHYFEAKDDKAHERDDDPDYCVNCDSPFMDHYNGMCPTHKDYPKGGPR